MFVWACLGLIKGGAARPGVSAFSGGRAGTSTSTGNWFIEPPAWYESYWWALAFCGLIFLIFWLIVARICWVKRREIKETKGKVRKSLKRNKRPKHTGTLIFFHGMGDKSEGWATSLKAIRPPHVKVICPMANKIPVTINAGLKIPAWFDVVSFDASGAEDCAGIKSASMMVNKMIADEIKAGIPSHRIMIGGFSQGGALALFTALHTEHRLGGVIALSCWAPLQKEFPITSARKINLETPFLQGHGELDPVVPYALGQFTSTLLSTFLENYEFKSYKSMKHTRCEEEMQHIRNFMESNVPMLQIR